MFVHLISPSQLIRSLNCYFTATANFFVIQEHGMWSLLSCNFNPQTLHDRLHQPSFSKLNMMISSLKRIQALDCESCSLFQQVSII